MTTHVPALVSLSVDATYMPRLPVTADDDTVVAADAGTLEKSFFEAEIVTSCCFLMGRSSLSFSRKLHFHDVPATTLFGHAMSSTRKEATTASLPKPTQPRSKVCRWQNARYSFLHWGV